MAPVELIISGPESLHALKTDRPLLAQVQVLVLRRDAMMVVPVGWQAWVLNLRGVCRAASELGVQTLPARHWLVSDPELPTSLRCARRGLTLVIASNPAARRQLCIEHRLLPGLGPLKRPDCQAIVARMRVPAGVNAMAMDTAESALEPLIDYLLNAQGELGGQLTRVPGKSRTARLRTLARLQRARLFASCHVDQTVRVADMARLARLSIWHFSRIFARVYDATALEFVQNLRLQRARDMLRAGDRSANEVANICGFHNASAFARAFKRRFGHSPTQTRLQPQFDAHTREPPLRRREEHHSNA